MNKNCAYDTEISKNWKRLSPDMSYEDDDPVESGENALLLLEGKIDA